MGKSKRTIAAGFVIMTPDLRRVLVLIQNGKGDLPKGMMNPGETSLECALRETFEEAGVIIDPQDIVSRVPCTYEGVDIYVAVKECEPYILPNPKTGITEHEGYKWMTWREAERFIPRYLRHGIEYARAISSTLIRVHRDT